MKFPIRAKKSSFASFYYVPTSQFFPGKHREKPPKLYEKLSEGERERENSIFGSLDGFLPSSVEEA